MKKANKVAYSLKSLYEIEKNKKPKVPPKTFKNTSSISKTRPICVWINSIERETIKVIINTHLNFILYKMYVVKKPKGMNINRLPMTFLKNNLLPILYLNISLKGIKLYPVTPLVSISWNVTT